MDKWIESEEEHHQRVITEATRRRRRTRATLGVAFGIGIAAAWASSACPQWAPLATPLACVSLLFGFASVEGRERDRLYDRVFDLEVQVRELTRSIRGRS